MRVLSAFLMIAAIFVFASSGLSAEKKKPTAQDLKSSLEHQTKGNDLDEQGKTKEAIEEYQAALKFAPDDTNTLFNMGTAYLKVNRPEDAAKALETLVKIDDKDVEAYNLLGLAYRGCGKKDSAISAWKRSLDINPGQTLPKKFIEEAK